MDKIKPEKPVVEFENGLQDDESENIKLVLEKYRNKLIPQTEAIRKVNNIDQSEAVKVQEEITKEKEVDLKNSAVGKFLDDRTQK